MASSRKSKGPKVTRQINTFAIGRVVGTHGIKGELKIRSYSPQLKLDQPAELWLKGQAYQVESLRPHKNNFLFKLVEIKTMDEALKLVGQEASVAANLVDSETQEQEKVLGLKAYDQNGTLLGTITELIRSPAHPILVIKNSAEEERLVPLVKKFVRKIAQVVELDLTDLAEYKDEI